ncbi:Icc Predicted phosphohydrolases [Rhabdaerophilaceae bacterium]
MKIIQITDIHLVRPGETMHGLDPAERLSAVIDDVLLRHSDADLTVITGDLTDRADPEAYAILRSAISRLPMRVQLLLGNHDHRARFLAEFPDTEIDAHGFVQSAIDMPGKAGRLLCLDTHETGWSGGRYCEQRLEWLDAELSKAPSLPVTLFMHHPPGDIGVTHFEKINLQQPEALIARLQAHPGGVRMIFIGHLHLPMNGVLSGGLPFTTGRSCTHHMVFNPATRDCDWVAGGPNYSVILISDDRLLSIAVDGLGAPLIGRGAYPPGP